MSLFYGSILFILLLFHKQTARNVIMWWKTKKCTLPCHIAPECLNCPIYENSNFGIRENFASGFRNPGILSKESEIQLKKSGIPLMIGIWNPIITHKESGIQYLQSEIQDCIGMPYMGQHKQSIRIQYLQTWFFIVIHEDWRSFSNFSFASFRCLSVLYLSC